MKVFFRANDGGEFIVKCTQNQESSFSLTVQTFHIFRQPSDYVNFQHMCWSESGVAENSPEWQSRCPLQVFAVSSDSLTFIDVQKFNERYNNENQPDDFNTVSRNFENCKLTINKGEKVTYTWNSLAYELSYE